MVRFISSRLSILSTATFGILGLVLFRLGAEIGKGPMTDSAPLVILVIGLLLLLSSAFAQIDVARAARNELPASSLLRLNAEETRASNDSLSRLLEAQLQGYLDPRLVNYLASQSNFMAAMKTEEAAARLAQRNARAKRRLGVAQFLFAFALPYLFLALSLWVYTAGQ